MQFGRNRSEATTPVEVPEAVGAPVPAPPVAEPIVHGIDDHVSTADVMSELNPRVGAPMTAAAPGELDASAWLDGPTIDLLDLLPGDREELLPAPPRVTSPRLPDTATIAEPPVAPWPERRFWPLVAAITAVAAVIRLGYVLTDHRLLVGGDGFGYHLSALRLADGLGYTRAFGRVGAAAAYHPPGWTSLLGAVSWLGARSVRDHQLVGVAFGLVVVVLAAMIGRRYFNARVGLVAAGLAAIYPGFWLLEGNVLAEPLALALLGIFTILVADLRDRPTKLRSAVVGVVAGLLVLTRSEEFLVVGLVLVPVLLMARSLSMRKRISRLAVVVLACVAMLAPWAVYNTSRFSEPVYLSTGAGRTLLAGNCAPGSFRGENLGLVNTTCYFALAQRNLSDDESVVDLKARQEAIDNVRANVARMPVVLSARLGRMLVVFRPDQTVNWVARWMRVDSRLIWAWAISFWLILVVAARGAIVALRRRYWSWPLVAPLVVVLLETLVFYGEPRYHTMADLGLLVLAAFAVVQVLSRGLPLPDPRPPSAAAPRLTRSKRPGRLPSVHVPR